MTRETLPQSKQQPSQPPQETDEPAIQYFYKADRIQSRSVSGHFRNLKWLTMAFALGIYYLAPFLRFDRGPNAPDQAILIDMPNRKAYWFFIEIWPQEVYILTGILIVSAVALFFVTSLFGRVWCGYLCPQTVWTDLFSFVERKIQGDRNARLKLSKQGLTFEKIWKKGLTHILWLLIGLCTGGAFVFYFNDAPMLWHAIWQGDVSPTVLAFIGGLTFSTYFMAGYARENVCTYMCPYARFQSAMFDKDTLIIGYDTARGEPRGNHKKGESWENRGHCIDCTACVQVCPMGIDIRDGLQMECITCGLCIDACDAVMDKLDLPKGLIRYDSEKGLAEGKKTFRIWRPRTFYYLAILAVVCTVIIGALVNRSLFELHVMHDRNPLYVQLSDGRIRNGYQINILNKTNQKRSYELEYNGAPDMEVVMKGPGINDPYNVEVGPGEVKSHHIFITVQPDGQPRSEVTITLKEKETGQTVQEETMFIKGESNE